MSDCRASDGCGGRGRSTRDRRTTSQNSRPQRVGMLPAEYHRTVIFDGGRRSLDAEGCQWISCRTHEIESQVRQRCREIRGIQMRRDREATGKSGRPSRTFHVSSRGSPRCASLPPVDTFCRSARDRVVPGALTSPARKNSRVEVGSRSSPMFTAGHSRPLTMSASRGRARSRRISCAALVACAALVQCRAIELGADAATPQSVLERFLEASVQRRPVSYRAIPPRGVERKVESHGLGGSVDRLRPGDGAVRSHSGRRRMRTRKCAATGDRPCCAARRTCTCASDDRAQLPAHTNEPTAAHLALAPSSPEWEGEGSWPEP